MEDEILIEARILAHKHKISDVDRVVNIMKKTAIDRKGLRV